MNIKVYYHKFSNGKGYVGITKNTVESRLKGHTYSKNAFGCAIRKYGIEDLETVILCENIENYQDAGELEIKYIEELKTHISEFGYNMTRGGGTFYIDTKGKTYEEIYGPERAKEKREFLRNKFKGRYFSYEWRQNMVKNHAHLSGEDCHNFKYLYFLTPEDKLIKGVKGQNKTVKEFKIPVSIFWNKIKRNNSRAYWWAYIEKDSFNYSDEEIIDELKEIRYNFWVNTNSPFYKYELSKPEISEVTRQKLRDWKRPLGEENWKFKFFYFLTPEDKLIKGDLGFEKSKVEYKIPNSLFYERKMFVKSVAENWSYVEKDSFNYSDEEIIDELKEIRYNFWVNKESPLYKYDHSKTMTTFISPEGKKFILYTREEYKEFIKENNFYHPTVCEVIRGRIVSKTSPLFGWKIFRGLNEN